MSGTKASPRRNGYKRTERVSGMIMSAPAVILLAAFLIIPIIYTIYYSFFTYQVIRPDNIIFSGIENYISLFQDGSFWQALKNTVYFTVLVVPVQCVLALALAMLVSSRRRGVSIFRTMSLRSCGRSSTIRMQIPA